MVAWCRPEQQLERLMAKTGVSREEAERRIQAQMPVEEKRRRADYVIDCSGAWKTPGDRRKRFIRTSGELRKGRMASSRRAKLPSTAISNGNHEATFSFQPSSLHHSLPRATS